MLVPTLLLAGPVLLLQAEEPQEAPAAGSSAELALELVERGDYVSAEQLEVLAGYGDRDAFDGLVRILDGLTRRTKIGDTCHAFVGFAGTELEAEAVTLLSEKALGWPMDPATRPSARALASLGTRASEALLHVARDSVDQGARAIAVGALAPVFVARSRNEATRQQDFELVLDAYYPPLSGTQAFGAELLGVLARGDQAETLRDVLWDEDQGTVRRSLAAAALVELGDGDSLQAARRALRASDPEVALAVLAALKRHGAAVDPDRLRRLSKAGDPRLAYAATLAHCRVLEPATAARELPQLARASQPERRAAVASFLGASEGGCSDPKLEALFLQLVEDEDLAVRIAALPGLALRRSPETVDLLVRRMWVEGERMRARIREVLVELTASDHGPRPARWGAFWDDRHEDFELPSKGESIEYMARREEAQGRGSTRSFFGLDLGSDRVAFVCCGPEANGPDLAVVGGRGSRSARRRPSCPNTGTSPGLGAS